MPVATFLPERSGNRIWGMWTRVTDTVPVGRLVGICLLVIAACTVTCALVPGVLPSEPLSLPLFLITLVTLLALGSWLVLYPAHAELAMMCALTLGPVIFAAMVVTWDDEGLVIAPVALLFTGACTAAFYSPRILALQIVLDVGATLVYLIRWFGVRLETREAIAMGATAAGYMFTIALFTGGVYLMRRHVERIRDGLQARSLLDDLTGVPNRLHLQQVAAALTAGALRHDREVYALIIDVDRMDAINQVHGVLVGDEVLRAVTAAARATLRPEDVFIRLGGDELLAAGVVRSQFEAVRVAERLRQTIRRAELPVDVTCSIGVATARPSGGLDPIEWMWNLTAVAEESLAAAKASGRDRVTPARQSGDVLGDALEVVTSRAGTQVVQVQDQPMTKDDRWFSPEVLSRVLAVIIVAGLCLVASIFPRIQSSVRLTPEMAILAGACLFSVATVGYLLKRPASLPSVMAVLIIAADVMWASALLVAGDPQADLNGVQAAIMGLVAAWLLSRRMFVTQMIVTFPLMYVVMRSGGDVDQTAAIFGALMQGGGVVIASVGLYLLRLHGDELIEHTQALGTTDPITGLPNRRLLVQRAPAIVSGAARLDAAVSVTVIDIDEFWKINEHQGIPGGDKVLAEVARVLYRTTRVEDLLLRLGGDDFVIVALGDPEDARRHADRASEAINGIWAFGSPLRCSAGFAVGYPEQGVDPTVWLMSLIGAALDSLRQTREDAAEAEQPVAAL